VGVEVRPGVLDPDSVDVSMLGQGFHSLRTNVCDTTCLGMGDERKLGDNCKILSRPSSKCHGRGDGATLLGMATNMAWVCRKCGCNAHNAMCNRHGVPQPVVVRDFQFVKESWVDHKRYVDKAYWDHLMIYEDGWLAKWNEVKRVLIEKSRVFDVLCADRVKNMVKREVYHKPATKARCIQYYSNFYTQSYVAPEITALQKAWTERFYRAGDRVKITFASGMNARQLGDWMKEVLADYRRPMFYERDGKSWDATMSEKHHDFKVWCYGVAGDRVKNFVDSGRVVRGFGLYPNGILRYSLAGTTKSGHNDTTLGNSLINAAIAYSACARMGLCCDIIVAGDDLLVVIEGDFDEHALAKHESDMGILPEYRKFSMVEDVSFISGIWFPIDEGFIFTPKPGRLLARLFWSVKPPSKKKFRPHIHSIVAGMQATCGTMPVIGAFLVSQDYPNEPVLPPVGYWEEYKRLFWADNHTVPRRSFLNGFLRRYGLDESSIEDVETLFLNNQHRIGIVSHPVLDRIAAVDMSDIDKRPTLGI
jgi:hypothetical protein